MVIEKYNPDWLYCMFCLKKTHKKQMYVTEGKHDVCRDEKCIDFYIKARKIKMKRDQQNSTRLALGENGLPSDWMNGDF